MAEIVWTERQRAEVGNLQRLRMLFEGNHETYFVLPSGETRRYTYVTVNWLGDVLSQTWKRLLWRTWPDLVSRASQPELERLVETLDMPSLVLPATLHQSWAGRAVWKAYWSRLSGAPVLELWEKDDSEVVFFDYLPYDRTRPVGVQFWRLIELPKNAMPGEMHTKAWVCERHTLGIAMGATAAPSVAVSMEVTAYRCEGGFPVSEVLPPERVWPDEATRPAGTAGPVVTPGLAMLPCVVVRNVDRTGRVSGDSDYTPSLIRIQEQVNKLVASRQWVCDTCEEPNLALPEDVLNPDGSADWSRVKLRIKYPHQGQDAGSGIDISGWTGNLENSAAQWEGYRREFRALTGIAPALHGETEGSGGESGYARRLGMVPTEAEVGARRRCWQRGLREAVALAQTMERAYGPAGERPAVTDLSVTWPEAIPEDSTQISQTTTQEHREGVRSLRSSVERLNPDWTQEQVDAEVTAIEGDAERRRALAVPDLANPFGDTGNGGAA